MKDKNSLTDMLRQIGLTKKLADFYLYILESGPIDLRILLQKSSHRGVAEEKTKLLEDIALRKLIVIDRYAVFPLNPKTVFKAVGHLKLWQDIVDWDIERVSENNKMKIKDYQETCMKLGVELYKYYKHKSPVSLDKIKLAKNADDMSSLLAEAIAKGNERILAVSKSPRLSLRLSYLSLIWANILEKISSGVCYIRIVDFGELEEHGLKIVSRDVNEIGVDLRILEDDEISHKFYIVDDSIVVIFSPTESSEFSFKLEGQIIGNKLIAKQYRKIFNGLYLKSVSAKPVLLIMAKIKNKAVEQVLSNFGKKEAQWLKHLIDYGSFAKFPNFSPFEKEVILSKMIQSGYVEMRDLPIGSVPIFPYKLTLKEIRKNVEFN